MKNVILGAIVIGLIYYFTKGKKAEVSTTVARTSGQKPAYGDMDLTNAINLTLERVR